MLLDMLRASIAQHPLVGEFRGRGLFVGAEFVQNREIKTCFDPSVKFSTRLKEITFSQGATCYSMGGVLDGKNGDHVLLAPPFINEREHLGEVIDEISAAIGEETAVLGL